MNEHDLETRLRRTYRVETGKADPGALSERVRSIPATVEPQRPRWWLRFRPGVSRHDGPGGTQVRGAKDMMAVTGAAAVVAALALGASFLAVEVGGPKEATLQPGAPVNGAWVTVTGTQRIDGGALYLYGELVDMTDPRLDGWVTISYEMNGPNLEESPVSTLWSTVSVTNADGSWDGQSVGFVDETGAHHHMDWLKGDGAYEGLAFIGELSEKDTFEAGDMGGGLMDVVGLVYEGELPPMVLPSWTIE